MGSPLGQTLAIFFLANFETNFMTDGTIIEPDLYLRYVDDIFCTFNSDSAIHPFLNYLNSLHRNLKFTMEVGQHKLTFLDTEISLPTSDLSHEFLSSVHRKATNTNVILNYCAVCPIDYKIGLIKCLLNRAFVICNTWS